jgi:hypothetical protein
MATRDRQCPPGASSQMSAWSYPDAARGLVAGIPHFRTLPVARSCSCLALSQTYEFGGVYMFAKTPSG